MSCTEGVLDVGCGTLDWADLFDHVSELLSDEEDAPVRDHLASCEACRADSGELMVLSEGFWALGILTHVTGRDEFADRTRSEVREVMGDKSALRSTGAWRAISAAESQRLRRTGQRRGEAIRSAVTAAAAIAAVLVGGVALLFYYGAVAYLVDTSGRAVEDPLGVDLAEWGLRRTHGEVAELARAAKDVGAVRALAGEVRRLLRRELSLPFCRAGAVARLEFAHTLTLRETVAARELIASAILEADLAQKPQEPVHPELLGVVRKARRLRLDGKADAAREVLLIPAIVGEALALYYSGVMLADSGSWDEGASSKDGSSLLGRAAGEVPAVWPEIAWRWLRAGDLAKAREKLQLAPDGGVKKALSALLVAGGGPAGAGR